jgi:hypothetical protein
VCGTVVPNEPSRSFRSAGVGAIPLWHDRGACSLASCAIASFGEGPAMKLRYIIAIMAAALAVSYHRQDTRLAVLVIFCTCILYSLRCIDYQLGDMKGRIHALSNPSHLSSRDILLHAALSPSRQLIEASSHLLDAGPPWEFYQEGALVMKREINGSLQYRDATPEERHEFLRRELWSLQANRRRF